MSDTPLHSAGFPGYCSLMDLNGCVVTCIRDHDLCMHALSLLFEPIKIYHQTPADDLVQAMNSIIQHPGRKERRNRALLFVKNGHNNAKLRGLQNAVSS